MRRFVNVIVVLVGCFYQLSQSQEVVINEAECRGKENNYELATGSPCVQCTCMDEFPQCVSMSCLQIVCHPDLVVHEEGQCCPTCRPGCYDENLGFGLIPAGETVSDKRGCTTCMCSKDSKLECVMMSCLPCDGTHVDDGTCCGSCTLHQCKVDGVIYENGEEIPSPDPCHSCHCIVDDTGHVDVECRAMPCDKCFYNNVIYEIGEDVPTKDKCSQCVCQQRKGNPEIICYNMLCPACFPVVQDGTCCGKCVPSDKCVHDNTLFSIGDEIPSKNPCEYCTCASPFNGDLPQRICAVMDCAPCKPGYESKPDGTCCGTCIPATLSCELVRCRAPPCSSNMHYQAEGQCCPDCKCEYNGRMYNPGPFGRKCAGCVCENGKATCTKPVCPEKNLECVDAVRGEDCCFHCPNGKTCFYGRGRDRVVIRYGEYSFINGRIVTCSGDPWFPVAFSVGENVPWHVNRAMRRYKSQVADSMTSPSP